MIAALIRILGRPLLRLRYRVRLEGLDRMPPQDGRGILFLATHPSLVDPFILVTELHRSWAPTLVAGREHTVHGPLRWLARAFGVTSLPDPAQCREGCREAEAAELAQLAARLRAGRNLLLFPGGRLARQKVEDLSGNHLLEPLLRQAPGAHVVVVRVQGLWGSRFSAASGQRPVLGRELLRGLGTLLANGLVFGPRREVRLVFEEVPGVPLDQGPAPLCRALESRLNADPSPRTYVPHVFWHGRASRVLPEPPRPRVAGNPRSVPASVRDAVRRHLQVVSGHHEIQDGMALVADLGLDGLALRELELWLERAFGYPCSDPASLQTVGDVLLAATGAAVSLR
ncbi:MAG TPA: 1-acyl-sn-glycerol-3-phosphate acyltransferase, partial [Holophagaceae bacterium]